MGQVIHLTVPSAAYPATTDALCKAESVFLLCVRWWVADYRLGQDPIPRLCEAMRIAGPHDAAFSVDQFMATLARTARQPVTIHCPRCRRLSQDEMHLLYAASLVQVGENRLAESTLRTTLMSAAGAEFALGSLEGLGELFAESDLRFRRRSMPADPLSVGNEGWTQPGETRSIH